MSSAQGMTINYSMVTDENGQKEIGFRYNDSDGVDIDKHYTGKKEDDLLSKLCYDVVDEMQKQTAAINKAKQRKMLNEKKKADNKKKNYDEIIAQLQRELKEAKEENQSLKLDNEILNKRVKDNLNTQPKQPTKEVPTEKKNEDYLSALLDEYDLNDALDAFLKSFLG